MERDCYKIAIAEVKFNIAKRVIVSIAFLAHDEMDLVTHHLGVQASHMSVLVPPLLLISQPCL